MTNLTKHHYSRPQNPAEFLEGFTRVNRVRSTRLMSEAQRRAHAIHESRVAAAAEFLNDLIHGHIRSYYLQEMLRPSTPQMAQVIESNYPGLIRRMTVHEAAVAAATFGADLVESMTTSDFPLLVGDVIDRMMLQRFAEVPQVWRDYISVGRALRDFRLARLIQTDGGDGQWDEITEEEGLKYTNITESGHGITAALYGKALRLAWRLLVNDDLDAFASIPDILGRGGRRTIAKAATSLLFDSNGPKASFINVGNGNLLAGNPPLNVTNLGLAIQQFAQARDSEGEPIALEGIRLVYGPGLRITVQNILNQLTIDVTDGGGTSARVMRVNNWMVRGLTDTEDAYIPIVATTNGDTSWMLTSNPNVSRPAARIRFLRGFEQPQLYMKAPNTMRIGGGLDEGVGDFYSMATEYKGMVAFGGTTIEPKAVIGSNGSGS